MSTRKKSNSQSPSIDAAAKSKTTTKPSATQASPATALAQNDANCLLLKSNLKQLRLPTMKAEFEQLAREAAESNQTF